MCFTIVITWTESGAVADLELSALSTELPPELPPELLFYRDNTHRCVVRLLSIIAKLPV